MQPRLSFFYALKRAVNYRMGTEDTPNEFYETLISLLNDYESYGGKLEDDEKLMETDSMYSALSHDEKDV